MFMGIRMILWTTVVREINILDGFPARIEFTSLIIFTPPPLFLSQLRMRAFRLGIRNRPTVTIFRQFTIREFILTF